MTPFSWCKRSLRAAELVAEGRLTGAQAAAEVGLSRQGLDRWKAHPEFKARVADRLAEFDAFLRAARRARWEEEWAESDRLTAAYRAEKRAGRKRGRARKYA